MLLTAATAAVAADSVVATDTRTEGRHWRRPRAHPSTLRRAAAATEAGAATRRSIAVGRRMNPPGRELSLGCASCAGGVLASVTRVCGGRVQSSAPPHDRLAASLAFHVSTLAYVENHVGPFSFPNNKESAYCFWSYVNVSFLQKEPCVL